MRTKHRIAVFVYSLGGAAHDAHAAAAFFDSFKLLFGFFGQKQIVVTEPREPFAAHLPYSVIQRARNTAVLFAEISYFIAVGARDLIGPSAVV